MTTARQQEVLEFMAGHIVRKQRPPTRAEIAAHFGFASPNAAEQHIQALERDGYIECEASATGKHWTRYPRIVRWPASVLPVLQLARV